MTSRPAHWHSVAALVAALVSLPRLPLLRDRATCVTKVKVTSSYPLYASFCFFLIRETKMLYLCQSRRAGAYHVGRIRLPNFLFTISYNEPCVNVHNKVRGGGSGGRRSESARSESCHRLTEFCLTVKQRPVCASDGLTYSSKCQIRRLRRCERRLVAVVSAGHCPVGKTFTSLLPFASPLLAFVIAHHHSS